MNVWFSTFMLPTAFWLKNQFPVQVCMYISPQTTLLEAKSEFLNTQSWGNLKLKISLVHYILTAMVFLRGLWISFRVRENGPTSKRKKFLHFQLPVPALLAMICLRMSSFFSLPQVNVSGPHPQLTRGIKPPPNRRATGSKLVLSAKKCLRNKGI